MFTYISQTNMPASVGRCRYAVFTVNNWNTEEKADILAQKAFSYVIVGEEIAPETGTPHLQGYLELKKQCAFSTLKKLIPRAHFETQRKGTGEQAANYCKKDGKWADAGTLKNPGSRTDLKEFCRSIKRKRTFTQMVDMHPTPMCKYYRFYDRYTLELARQDVTFEPLDVTVVWGKSDTGKTRVAYHHDPHLHRVTDVRWWDGYTCQPTILIDDFYGENCSWSTLLQLLDGYKFQLPVKGGFTWKAYKKVFITSNTHPKTWYMEGFPQEFKRRITRIIHMTDKGAFLEDLTDKPKRETKVEKEGGGIVLPTTSE